MSIKKRKKPGRRGRNKILSRKAWLDLALRILGEEGLAGVRVERLARDLGVTKGSFYWHFVDRADLLENMLKYWADEFTGNLIEYLEAQVGDPAERLRMVMTTVDEQKLGQFDLAIRAWADHDPLAAAVVRRVYRARLNFIRGIFSEMGFTGDELEMRTRTVVVYYTWQHTFNSSMSRADRRKLRRVQHKLLTSLPHKPR